MKWISVEDRLPRIGQQVLAWAKHGKNQVPDLMLQVVFAGTDHWIYGYHNNDMNGVTDWMPLPEPPEKLPSYKDMRGILARNSNGEDDD